jgi:hypothetical protein
VSTLDALLVQAAAQPPSPYSATIRTQTLIGNAAVSTMTGPVNFNDKSMTGHFTLRTAAVGDTPASKVGIVMTTRAQYVRPLGTGSPKADWQKVPPSGSATIADLSGYARLLLKQGPAAILAVVGGTAMPYWFVAVNLAVLWLGLAVWLRRPVAWIILAGFLLLVALFVAAGILQSAAGPAVDWFHGTTPEDRAHGQGTIADISFALRIIAFLAFPVWVLVSLTAAACLVVDSFRWPWWSGR